jgi:hypothetical protein
MYWRGEPVANVRPTMVRVMLPLLRSGRATRDRMALALRDDSDALTVNKHVCEVRRAFRAAGVPVRIEPVFGWGYQLVMEEAKQCDTEQ